MTKAFLKAGHPPTLFAAFLYFDLSFMVWVLLGPLAGLTGVKKRWRRSWAAAPALGVRV